MFPSDIKKVAVVAIKNNEIHTLRFLVNELCGWMDSPNEETAQVAAYIGNNFFKITDQNGSLEDMKTANVLLKYAVKVLVPKNN